jgi:hypothetical protein
VSDDARGGPLPVGWQPPLRWVAGVVGVALLAAGSVAVFLKLGDVGPTALVAGGLVALLAAIAGGLTSVKVGDVEVSLAASALAGGDKEAAADRARAAVVRRSPAVATYERKALAALAQSADRMGQVMQELPGVQIAERALAGSAIAVDVRAGRSFDVGRVIETYRSLLDGPAAPFHGALVVVNAAPGASVTEHLASAGRQLRTALHVVAWQPSAPLEVLDEALVAIEWAVGGTAPKPDAGSSSAQSPRLESPKLQATDPWGSWPDGSFVWPGQEGGLLVTHPARLRARFRLMVWAVRRADRELFEKARRELRAELAAAEPLRRFTGTEVPAAAEVVRFVDRPWTDLLTERVYHRPDGSPTTWPDPL